MEKIIIFDYDGVIVDSLDVYEKAVISAFNRNGFNQISSRESFLALFDGNFFESAVKIGIPPEKMPAIIKELEPNLLSLQKDLKLFNGIREVLSELAKKYKIYIATSNLTGVVKAYLESQSIAGFEEIIGADKETSKVKKIENIKAKYPDSEIFYVGDTKGDMIEGNLAGVKTIAVAWGWHDINRLKEGKPDYIVEKPSELLLIINNFESIKTKTAGGVVVNLKGEILVVNQKGTSWSLPKGHIEKGEMAFEAAKREITEESGVTELEFIRELGVYQRYKIGKYGGDEKSELKTITMFLFKTNEKMLKPIDSENPEARWVPREKVADLLTHEKDKEFFRKIIEKL